MKSDISKKILSETSEETKNKVREKANDLVLSGKLMKNIHLLTMDKQNVLWEDEFGVLRYGNESFFYTGCNWKNIYITNDEEINQNTKPCWCLNTNKKTWNDDVVYYQGAMPQYHYIGFKKIILTTDPDLIKDGVQAIDDEFLEWFVKNSSCEFMETKVEFIQTPDNLKDGFYYKIIIPKEEPKQEIVIPANTLKVGDIISFEAKANFKEEPKQDRTCTNNCSVVCGECQIFKPKQETLEEFAYKYAEMYRCPATNENEYCKHDIISAVNNGAKWQQQQNNNLYSEVIDLLERSSSIYYEGCDLDINYESEKSKIINQLKEII